MTGLALGYIGEYARFLNESRCGAEYSSYKHAWLQAAAIAGHMTQSVLWGKDYQLTEAWLLHKHRIAIFNAAFFVLLTPFLTGVLKWIRN